LGKTSALRFENVKFFKKPALYALKTLNFKLTLPSLVGKLRASYLKKKGGKWPLYYLQRAITPYQITQ
jgi:hypothetical protein